MMYDVAIIGGGIGGLMAAYRLIKEKPNLSVVVIDKGRALDKRKCPLSNHLVDKCIKCKQCAIMEGIGGAGAFSDGKFNITTEYEDKWSPKGPIYRLEARTFKSEDNNKSEAN